jgi:hypothetical protein
MTKIETLHSILSVKQKAKRIRKEYFEGCKTGKPNDI